MNSKWISVNTPPKRCGLFLCWDENYSHNYPYEVFRYEIYNSQWSYAGDEFHPQFWQPLPLPPAEELKSISNESWETIFEKYSDENPLDVEQVRYWFIPFKNWLNKNYPRMSNGPAGEELSIDEIENVVSKGLDENYYPNLPKNKYKMISEDELMEDDMKVSLLEMWKHCGVQFPKSEFKKTYKECAKIALQYHQSKIAELEEWIDEQEKKAETNDYFIYAPDLMDKIKSL